MKNDFELNTMKANNEIYVLLEHYQNILQK